MSASWQDVVVIGAVLVALAYVAGKVWRRFSSHRIRCCDTCRGCPAERKTGRLITLDGPRSPGDE